MQQIVGVKEMSSIKKAEFEAKDLLPYGAAAAVGLGVAALTKKPGLLGKAKKPFNWIVDYPTRFTSDRKNIIDRTIGKLLYGDTKFYSADTVENLKKIPKKLPGHTYYEVGTKFNKKLLPKSKVDYNKNIGFIDKNFQNKINFSKLKSSGSIAKGLSLIHI